MKGLSRSLSRGIGLESPIQKKRVYVNVTAEITDPGSANAPFTAVAGDFPEGNLLFLGAVFYPTVTRGDTDISATFTGNLSVGSAATADATLSGAEVDIIPSTAMATGSSGISSGNRFTNATQVMLDNTDGSLEINVNGYIADAAISADSSVTVAGWLEYAYIPMLDD